MPAVPAALRAAARGVSLTAVVATGLAITLSAAVTVVAAEKAAPSAAAGPPTRPGSVSEGAAQAAAAPAPTAETLGRPPVEGPPVAALAERLQPEVLVTAPAPVAPGQVEAVAAGARTLSFRAGTVTIGGRQVPAVGVDPSTFRAYTAEGTAEADAVWQAVARGEAVGSHALGKEAGLQLGGDVEAVPAAGGPRVLRLGALATTGIPGAELVVDDATGAALGLLPSTAVLVDVAEGTDPGTLAEQLRGALGEGAAVELLTAPSQNPVAFLSGSKAAEAFGRFSYRYFPDGTIAPDDDWVQANIVTATVPIMGRVTCHRLMVPQLRGALQEVQDAGLGGLLRTYDGCYVPRFIARNPDNSISLHTWGIAIDMDAATNYRGIRGTMDLRIVEIFKRWGFAWGGDWRYTDPMHFELSALLTSPKG